MPGGFAQHMMSQLQALHARYSVLFTQGEIPIHVEPIQGEQFSSKWEFRQLIAEERIDYARIDLCIVGGFTEARKIAGWAETHYIKLAVRNPLGPISSATCLQLNLASPLVGVQEQLRKTGTVLTDVVPVQPKTVSSSWGGPGAIPHRYP